MNNYLHDKQVSENLNCIFVHLKFSVGEKSIKKTNASSITLSLLIVNMQVSDYKKGELEATGQKHHADVGLLEY